LTSSTSKSALATYGPSLDTTQICQSDSDPKGCAERVEES
jgi:hypothetical protein